jgi:hypothetical protein
MSSFHWSTMIFCFVIASKIVLLSFAKHFGGNLPAPTSPLYLFDQVLLVYPSRTFSIPNSQRDVQLPLVYNDILFRHCFKDSIAEFCQTLWWQPACPNLAFVPLRPSFVGVPFQDLFHISYFSCLRYGGFMIGSSDSTFKLRYISNLVRVTVTDLDSGF